MTLIELTIMAVVIALVSAAVFSLVVSGQRIWAATSDEATASQDVDAAAHTLASQLQDSTLSSITVGSKAVSFASGWGQGRFHTDPETGAPVWQHYVIYYVPPGSTHLLRATWTPSSGELASGGPLSAGQLQSFVTAHRSGELLCSGVTGLQAELTAQPPSLTFTISQDRVDATGHRQTQTVRRSVRLRN